MGKLRIAVCFSGQLRGSYKKNIEKIKSILPDYCDYYFTTWDDQPKEDFIQKVHKAPVQKYNAAYPEAKASIELLKKFRNGNLGHEAIHRYQHMSDRRFQEHMILSIKNMRKKGRTNFQHVAHAMLIDDLVDLKKYDIIVRLRYDVFMYDDLSVQFETFCQQVYDYSVPYGFHCFNETETVDGFVNPVKSLRQCISRDLHDFMIIHRADMFDPNFVLYLHKNRQLRVAEGGWYQVLCRPWGIFGAAVSGYVRMQLQHDDQNEDFDKYRKNPTKKTKYDFKETMGFIVTKV
jgi:hypothetical protein